MGTRSRSAIRRSASAIVGAERFAVITRSARQRRLPIADHEPRRAVVPPSPRLGVLALGLVADAHDLVDDLTPSLDADAPPIRAFEHGEELAVRVAEAGSDLDLHGPRIRPAAGDPTGISAAVDVPNGMRDSRDVRTYT